MGQDVLAVGSGTARADGREARAARTNALLVCGMLLGPLFLVVATVQAFAIEGFDLSVPSDQPAQRRGSGVDPDGQLRGGRGARARVRARRSRGPRRRSRQDVGAAAARRLRGRPGPGRRLRGGSLARLPAGDAGRDARGAQLARRRSRRGVRAGVRLDHAGVPGVRAAVRDARATEVAMYSVATAVVALALSMWPDRDGASVRYFVATVIASAWTTAIAARLRRYGSR